MWLIVLEAVGALAVLVFVVWWTMFSGRRGGELPPDVDDADEAAATGKPSNKPHQGHQDDGGEDLGGSKKLKG